MRYLLVNFGGPRTLKEVPSFLTALLSDQEVIRTYLPQKIHNAIFSKIAQKRAVSVREDYASIGGKSPIYEDTEWLAHTLSTKLNEEVGTFHRYLVDTHKSSLEKIASTTEKIYVFPLFPQFSYATTGSIATYFAKHLPSAVVDRLRWIRSYPTHPGFIFAYQEKIRSYLKKNGLDEEEVILLFSAHGVPKRFVKWGDSYGKECRGSYHHIMKGFPKTQSRLCFQSKFGPGKWLEPYTKTASSTILQWNKGKKHVVFVPITFTSDHIETLFEIESDYMPLIRKNGVIPHRVDALNRSSFWIEGMLSILKEPCLHQNHHLMRNPRKVY